MTMMMRRRTRTRNPLCVSTALEAQHFVRYTQARTWNEARQVCQNEGTELASINRFSTAYLVKAVAATPVYK